MIYLFDESKTLTGTVRDEHVRSLLYDRETNGMYDLSAEIPVIAYHQGNRYNLHTATKNAVFLGHYDLEGRFQLHKIAGYDVNSDTIAILGVHIFFDEAKAGAIIKDRRYIDREVSVGARDAFAEIGWQLADYDVSPPRTYNFYNVSPLEARAILIETFGFEFDYWIDFDGKKISGKYFSVKKQIGQDSGKRYTYDKHTNTGHHVLELTAETDYSEVFTAVIGRGRGEEIEDTGGYGRRIEYTDISWSKPNRPLDKPRGSRVLIDPEATQAFGYVQEDGTITPRTAVVVFSDIERQSELLEASYDWLVEHRHPKLVFDVNVADGDGLELGDTVYIKYNEIGLNMAVRVGKVIDDLKSGERQVQLGDVAYFKPGRSNRDINRSIRQERRDANSRIYQLKLEFDERFDNTVNQMRDDYEQALIDAHAEIQASEQRMTTLIESERTDLQEEFDSKVADSREYADSQIADKEAQYEADWNQRDADIQQTIETVVGGSVDALETNLLDVNSQLLSKLDEADLQPLNGRIDDAFSDISDVSGNLDTARSELQQQLVDARAELEGIEYENRNYVLNSNFLSGDTSHWIVDNTSSVRIVEGGYESGYAAELSSVEGSQVRLTPDVTLKPGTYTMQIWYKHIEGQVPFLENNGEFSRIFGFEEGEGWQVLEFTRTIENESKPPQIRYASGYPTENVEGVTIIGAMKIERGIRATPHSTAPEDTEEKITTLSESIEYIDGQLEAKLNRTEIEPLQNKITEYGTTLDANADSIGLLQEKTELHDDDITMWSNLAESTAEEMSRTLTRISDIDGEIETAQTRITTEAGRLDALFSQTNTLEGKLSDAELAIEANAEGLGLKASRVELENSLEGVQGRNLLVKSAYYKNNEVFDVYKNPDSTSIYAEDTWRQVTERYVIGSSEKMTISGWFKPKNGAPTGIALHPVQYIEQSGSAERSVSPHRTFNIGEDWTYIVYELTTHEDTQSGTLFVRASPTDASNEVWINGLTINKGTKPLPYAPAPEETESKITQLNTDINIEAGRIDALLTRTSEAEQSIADISIDVDGITADFANYKQDINGEIGQLSGQVASYEASVDGFRAEVGTLQGDINDVDSWIADKGAVIDGTADAISARVWQQDIDAVEVGGRNLLLDSKELKDTGDLGAGISRRINEEGHLEITAEADNNNYASGLGLNIIENHGLKIGDKVTFSIKVKSKNATGNPTLYIGASMGYMTLEGNISDEWSIISWTREWRTDSWSPHMGFKNTTGTFVFKEAKLEKGNKATDWSPAPEGTLMKTDFELRADGFFLGGNYVGGDHYSTAIAGSEDGISVIANEMRLTGDLLVAGDVTALAVDAIEGNFARLFASSLTTNVIKSNHIQTDTALVEKLFATNANIDELITRTHFSDSIKTMSLDAVDADIGNLRTKILEANVINATHVNFTDALVRAIYTHDAFIGNATIRAANIRDLNAISIHANTFSSSIPGSNREITMENGRARFRYGSIVIENISGRRTIIDGQINRSQTMTARMPRFQSSAVDEDESWYRTYSTSYEIAHEEYFVHEARHIRVAMAVHRWGASAWCDGRMETRSGKISNYITTGNDSSAVYDWLRIDMGEPLDRPVSDSLIYTFKTRNGVQAKRMHLGNRFLTDFPGNI